jgi:hypothetical protein
LEVPDLTGFFNCLLIAYVFSVVCLWYALYKLWKVYIEGIPVSGAYQTAQVIAWLLLLALVIVYTIYPSTSLFAILIFR